MLTQIDWELDQSIWSPAASIHVGAGRFGWLHIFSGISITDQLFLPNGLDSAILRYGYGLAAAKGERAQ